MAYPAKLHEWIEALGSLDDRAERIELLRACAARLRPVPIDVAEPPYPPTHRVPDCESDAYVWVVGNRDAAHVWCAVQNPQGVAAQALAALIQDGYAGLPATELAGIPDGLVQDLFGTELSMGKTMGLTSLIAAVRRGASNLSAA